MDYRTFLFAMLLIYEALCEEIFWDTTIVFSENMTLECVYPLTGILSQAEWFKISATKRESMAIFHPSFGVIIRKPYANRVYFLNSTLSATDMTLSFYNASEADIGFYSCYLHTFPFGPWEKVIQVVQSGNFELAGPSDKDLVTNPGNNITLSYQLKREQPMQIVTWEKIQPHQIDLLTFCNLSKGKSYVSKQQRPIMTNCSQGMTSSFIAFSYLTASDSGLYRCCFESSTGEKETFLIRLMVTNAEDQGKKVFCSEKCYKKLLSNTYEIESRPLYVVNISVREKDTAPRGSLLPGSSPIYTPETQWRVRFTPLRPSGRCATSRFQFNDKTTIRPNSHVLVGGTLSSLLLVVITLTITVIYCSRKRRRKRAPTQESWETQNKASSNNRSPTSINQSSEDIYVNFPAFSRRPKIRV